MLEKSSCMCEASGLISDTSIVKTTKKIGAHFLIYEVPSLISKTTCFNRAMLNMSPSALTGSATSMGPNTELSYKERLTCDFPTILNGEL